MSILIFVLILIFLFLSKKYFKRIKKYKNLDKILLEDILKSIYNFNQQNKDCSVDDLSNNLKKSNRQIQKSIDKIINHQLAEKIGKNILLTKTGKEYALKIIRYHRLYEKYLSEKTEYKESDWHKLAEEYEHNFSSEEADKLAAEIGNPVFDPHGDPIPTSDGQLPDEKSIPFTELKTNDVVVITHIEDEPSDIYNKIISKGIYKGIQIKFLGKFNNEYAFYANDKLCSLTTQEAQNINVGIPKLEKLHFGVLKKLSTLSIGEKGKIIGIAKSLKGKQRRRLMDMGIVPGTIIEAELESISGDLVAYNVRGTKIALRKNQTDKIYIEPI